MTKSKLFKAAWNTAREGAVKFGGSARSYFAAALRAAYAASRKPALTVFQKLDELNTELFLGRSIRRGTFAHRFICDNIDRFAKYGTKTRFSDKQVAIIDDLFAQFCR